MDFEGIKLFVANGLASGSIVAGEKDNLMFGTSLQSDMNEVRILDLANVDGSQNVRVIMRFSATVNYAIGAELVLYQLVA